MDALAGRRRPELLSRQRLRRHLAESNHLKNGVELEPIIFRVSSRRAVGVPDCHPFSVGRFALGIKQLWRTVEQASTSTGCYPTAQLAELKVKPEPHMPCA